MWPHPRGGAARPEGRWRSFKRRPWRHIWRRQYRAWLGLKIGEELHWDVAKLTTTSSWPEKDPSMAINEKPWSWPVKHAEG